MGGSAQERRESLDIVQPVVRGAVTDWEAMEAMWTHVFQALAVDPTVHPVLVTETPHALAVGPPSPFRRLAAEILVEGFGVPRVRFEVCACALLCSMLVCTGW